MHLRRSKTDQADTRDAVGITADRFDPLDAVTAWTRWCNWPASYGLHRAGLPRHRSLDRTPPRHPTSSIGTIINYTRRRSGPGRRHRRALPTPGFATSALAGEPMNGPRSATDAGALRRQCPLGYVDEEERFHDTKPTNFLRDADARTTDAPGTGGWCSDCGRPRYGWASPVVRQPGSPSGILLPAPASAGNR